jgi:hypothetical protein
LENTKNVVILVAERHKYGQKNNPWALLSDFDHAIIAAYREHF